MGCISILIPIIGTVTPFYTIQNRSNYPEVADLFDRVRIYLWGHCISMIDKSELCFSTPFFRLFSAFPDFSKMPSYTPDNLYVVFATAPTQNPYVFIPLVISQILVTLCTILAILAFRKNLRRWIAIVCISTLAPLTTIAISLGIANKIYKDVVPSYLNKLITVNVNRDGVEFSITGRLSDVGIRFHTESGISMLILLLILVVLALLTAIRWIFEGKARVVPDVPTTRVREMYAAAAQSS